MKRLFLLKYGELALKGKNRIQFEKHVIKNTKLALKGSDISIRKMYGRFLLSIENGDEKEILTILSNKIFGLSSVSAGFIIPMKKEILGEMVLKTANEYMLAHDIKSFRIATKRPFKNFPMSSLEVNMEMGGVILDKYPDLKVDLKNSDMTIYIEILQSEIFIYSEKIPTIKGLPVRTSGDAFLFLSGGIDSPVAGYLAQKRGCYLNAIYFHAPPYTPEKTKEKVIHLAEKLAEYQGKLRLFVVNFTESQLILNKMTKRPYFVVLGRRMMMRIANKIAAENSFKAFVTGENLGQVASQTIENIHCVNMIADLPVLRPLISFDKEDTMTLAKKIGTYDTSILPYDDCCSLFLPTNPATKIKPYLLEEEEKQIDIDSIVQKAVDTVEIINCEAGKK